VSTKCLLIDGLSCTLASQCASGICSPFYVDQDGDGYGTGTAVGFCGTTTPVGYAAQSGDCCDTATNIGIAKLIHPNADFQLTSAGGVCNITWDYDCSGKVETSPQKCNTCPTSGDCVCLYVDFPETDCGNRDTQGACQLTQEGPNLVCQGSGGATPFVSCR
jgi:hypothetical protein